LSILPLSGTYGNLSFLIDNLGADGATITRCAVSAEGTINIPDSIEGIPVTKIADNAFESCTKVTRVIVPKTILSVGNNAFEDCSELRLVGFEGRLPEIGTDAFIGAVNSFTVTNYGFLQAELLAEREVGRQEVLSSPDQFDLVDASTNQETIIELQEANDNLLVTLDEKSNQIISFESTLSAKQSELDTLGQIIETQDIQLSDNIAEISLLNDEVESLSDSLQIKETQIISLQNTVISKGNQIVSLKGDISNLNDSLDLKNSEILSLNEQVGSLSDSLTMKGNQIASLEESVATKMIQINSLEENISTLNTSLVEKNSQINSLDEQVTSLSDSLAQASNQSSAIEALNETINGKDQEITDLNKLYEDKCTQVISLTDEIETLNETIIDKIIEIGKLCERPTVEEIQDGRSGSILLRPNPSDNTITIDLRVEESGDLIDWQPTERTLSGTFPLNGDKKFYRFSLTE